MSSTLTTPCILLPVELAAELADFFTELAAELADFFTELATFSKRSRSFFPPDPEDASVGGDSGFAVTSPPPFFPTLFLPISILPYNKIIAIETVYQSEHMLDDSSASVMIIPNHFICLGFRNPPNIFDLRDLVAI